MSAFVTDNFNAVLGLTLLAVGGLGVLIGHVIAERDRREATDAEWEPALEVQRDPRPDGLVQGQYEREIAKPGHVPGEYLS